MMNFNLPFALRRLIKDKTFSLINIAGLGVGIACFLLIALYLREELSYDRQFANADRIYRLAMDVATKDGTPDLKLATIAAPVAPLLQQDFPQQIEAIARVAVWKPDVRVEQGDVSYVDAVFADNSIFTIFDFPWLAGDAASALQSPDSAVLTAATAFKLFGSVDALGKTLTLADNHSVKITGVIADLPVTTHLKFDMLVSINFSTSLNGSKALDNWFTMNYHTYVLLKQGADINSLMRKIPGFFTRHLDAEAAGVFKMVPMALTDLHLHSNRRGEMRAPGSIMAVSAFSVIAVIVLLVACINFMNLATAKATQRIREVGVRKAAGAGKNSLVLQFLGESVLMAGLAMLIALVCVELALPAFNAMVQKELTIKLLMTAQALPLLLLLVVVVGISAGIYPAFYIASYRPAAILRGQIAGGKGGAWLRRALVLLQFSVAIALLVSVGTVYCQIQFARNITTGYNKERVVVLSNLGREGVGRQWDSMKRELLANPDVQQVTAANFIPTRGVNAIYDINYQGGSERRSMPTMLVDFGFFETYGIELLAGRFFADNDGLDRRATATSESSTGSGTYILSEEAVRQLGWSPAEAVGKWLEVTCCGMGQGLVVGVVKDVQYNSIHEPTGPVLYAIPPAPGAFINRETRLGLREIAIKLSEKNIAASLSHIDNIWKHFHPNQPVTRFFLSDEFNALYQDEERQGRMLVSFALLAIFITSLGLYGLSCYNAERRTKEIGVRKVMGSSVWEIVLVLTNDFGHLVLLSNLIAWPVAYYAMNLWLQNFAYRINLTPLIFIGSGLIALCIAWATVGGTAAKAATAKPVLALRYE